MSSTLVLGCVGCLAAAKPRAPSAGATPEVVQLPVFKVTGEPLEDFGFRVSPDFDAVRSQGRGRVFTPVVDVVLPNTAASKAGVRPGDRIVTTDGESTMSGSFNSAKRHWSGILKGKWDEIMAGRSDVAWTLVVETAGTWEARRVTLQLPTPPPHWGSSAWRMPADRTPAVVPEPGPLAERARQVFDNGIWTLLRGSYVRGFQLPVDAAHPHFLCYQWTLWDKAGGHRIYVSRQRGRTDIILEAIVRVDTGFFSGLMPARAPDDNLASATTVSATDSRTYLTSPSGTLEQAWRLPRSNHQQEIPPGEARAGFEAEVDFWLNKVGQVSPLWPLGLIETKK